jgi:uncharacterized protein YdgA (DUF945 family)
MNKLLLGGGVVLAVGAIGAAVVGPNYLGEKIETVTKAQLATAVSKPFKAELVKYERGARSSEVEIKLGLDASCMGGKADADKTADKTTGKEAAAPSGNDTFLLYRAHLNHGPFAGGLNAASYTGELLLPPALQKKYEEATGQKVLASFTGTYGFGGASSQTITMPKFDMKMDENTGKLQFLGATVDAKSDVEGKKISYVGNMPGAIFESKQGKFTLGVADFNAKLNLIAPGIWESESSGKLKDVVAMNGDKPVFKLEGLTFSGANTVDDKKIMTSKVNMALAKISTADSKNEYTNAVYEFVINNIAAEPMARISAAQNCGMVPVLQSLMGSKAGMAGLAESSQAMNANNEATFKTMLADYKLIAAANPSIDIKKISVMTPDGVVDLNGQMKLAGIVESDWANPMLLLQRLDASMNVTFPAPLIPAQMQLMVTKSVTEGFATQKDKQLSTTFKFSQGKATLNGKPIEKMMSGGG